MGRSPCRECVSSAKLLRVIPRTLQSAAPRILVLDGDERAALAVTRSLIAAGFGVTVVAAHRRSLAGVSRGATGRVRRNDPLRAPAEYVREVARLAAECGAALLVPVTDASADAVLTFRHLLPVGVQIPFAPRERYEAASDKVHVHELALAAGIGIEESVIVTGPDAPVPTDASLYPAYVKPHRSVVGEGFKQKTVVRRAENASACAAILKELHPAAFPVLVQRSVRGPGEGIFVARWKGVTIARFAHRRLREKPPAGGVSVFRESIALDPVVASACDRLLDALDWNGVAMIEGKRDVERGGWRVMEINGRFWGSLQLAVDSGVDFPAILARAVLDGVLSAPPTWREGVRLRWEWGDVDHLLIRLRRSAATLGLPPDAPTKLGAVAAFLSHRFGRDRLEVFRWNDPLPFVIESLARLGVRP